MQPLHNSNFDIHSVYVSFDEQRAYMVTSLSVKWKQKADILQRKERSHAMRIQKANCEWRTCDGENDDKYPAQAWRSGWYNVEDDVATICNHSNHNHSGKHNTILK